MIHSIVCELCGCKVYQDNDASCYITYCAVHHSAPRLYEVCKNLARFSRPKECDCAEMFDHLKPCLTCSHELMLKAIAEVEKK